MWKLGHNNWIHYGWGDDLKKNRHSNEHLVYYFEDIPKNDSKNSIESAKYTVNTIIENYPSPYYLMCSGGVDSQAMLYSWYISKKSFHVVFVKYISKGIWFNEHDFTNLKLFTERYNIEVEFIEIDIIEFLETKLFLYAKQTDCDSFQICAHMRMTDEIIFGTIIFSGNYVNPRYNGLRYTQTALHRYAILNDSEEKKIIPFFFLHTPEIVDFLISMNNFDYHTKCQRYLEKGFPVIPQETQTNGFEILKTYYDQFDHMIPKKNKLYYYHMPSNRTIDLLYRYPLGIKNAKYVIKSNLKGILS
jgi:hypothetical protein